MTFKQSLVVSPLVTITVCTSPSSFYSFHRKLTKIRKSTGQGGTLSSFYKNTLNGNAGDFIVGFGNPDDPNTQYCESGDQCINDGKQYLGTQLAPNGTQSKIKHKRNYYMLESGMPFLSTRELEEGTVVKKVIKRSNAEMTLMKRGGQDPYELVDDVVRARLE